MKSFTQAGQAEILRAAQKDEQITSNLVNLVSDITHMLAGNRRWIKSHKLREALGNFLYYGFTTVFGFQTLGEEYTGIIQLNKVGETVPNHLLRCSQVLLNCGGEVLLLRLLGRLEAHLRLPADITHLRPEAQTKLISYVTAIKTLIPYIHRLHKSIFYLNGKYYHISKRFTGIKYVLVRQWLGADLTHSGFKMLGAISLMYLLLLNVHTSLRWWKLNHVSTNSFLLQETDLKAPAESTSKLQCALCLENRKHTTLTPCGHLFCWNCILEWVQLQQICPLCRERVLPSQVVMLQNYESPKK